MSSKHQDKETDKLTDFTFKSIVMYLESREVVTPGTLMKTSSSARGEL